MSRETNPVRVLEAVGEAKDTVRSLWQLFMFDISDVSGYEVQENGCYDSSQFMDGPDHSYCLPYLISVGDCLAGFAVVWIRKTPNRHVVTRAPDYYISDFFVLRKYRRQGTGRAAVNQLWDNMPGKWAVAQLFNHASATVFWRSVISERTGGIFEEEPAADVVPKAGFRMQEFFV